MKVLHINTFTTGGAAAAAIKIHHGLLKQGIESKFLSLMGDIASLNDPEACRSKIDSSSLSQYWRYFFSKFYFQFSTLQQSTKDYEIFTVPYTRFDLAAEPLVKEADIIHLHWVAGFIDYPTFFRNVNKPIVWTLHDMNPFLGGFHYAGDEGFNKSAALRKLDNDIKVLKQKVFNKLQNITVVCPSKWIMEASKSSNILTHLPHCHIPGAVNTETYTPVNKQLAREALNLPSDATILIFVSENTNTRRKGFDVFKNAINLIAQENNIKDLLILKIGHGACDIPYLRDMGRINDQKKMAEILSASDAMVLPSLEDNFPNVMLEANACGCPVIGFPAGGIKEFIIDSLNGILAKDMSAQALKNAINSFTSIKGEFNPQAIRNHIIQKYSLNNQVQAHLQMYKSLTSPVPAIPAY